jgi:hypothetical protein
MEKMSRYIAKIRFLISAALVFSVLNALYWYYNHVIPHMESNHPHLNAAVFTNKVAASATEATMTATADDTTPSVNMKAVVPDPSVPVVSKIELDENDPIGRGILSSLEDSFFRKIQTEIDQMDPITRCQRYHYVYDSSSSTTHATPRRIFYGTLIADESYELLNIVAAETYQIYSGMVFVESNRTQSFIHTRDWKHVVVDTGTNGTGSTATNSYGPSRNHRQQMIASLFGMNDINQIRIKPFINEDPQLLELDREQKQRDLIIEGWKELGMQPDDIGILADLDETFSRDYLRAIQICSEIPQFQYHKHHCHHESVKIVGHTLVYEGSPQCLTQDRRWFHPDIIMGHCIDGIGDPLLHPSAPRESVTSFVRAPGFGQSCGDWYNEDKIMNNQYPAWSAADFRRTCSGGNHAFLNQSIVHPNPKKDFTAYHFHNYFIDMNAIRYKYFSYGHPDGNVYTKPITQMSEDIVLMYYCVNDLPDPDGATWKRSTNILNKELNPLDEPIYFMDKDYRQRRHAHVHSIMKADDEMFEQKKAAQDQRILQQQQYVPFFDQLNDKDESASATVIAMAVNYDLQTHKRFVGSLRYLGYKGQIIVAVEPDPNPTIVDYLLGRGVTLKKLSWVNCTYMKMDNNNPTDICAHPYPDIKIRWSRFPLMRDWLMECISCTGPVMVADAHDLIFQRNPFDILAPKVTGLQLYQEHANLTTKNWLVEWPVRECKGITYDEPMLCSGTTIGTREAMLEYLTAMYEEMKIWINDPKCRFNINGDDQSILNYLYYSGKFPNETTISVPHRMGGIINTIGHHASVINSRREQTSSVNDGKYPGASMTTWIGQAEFGLTNEEGLLVELDGTTVSRVVHKWDCFGPPYMEWLNRQPWAVS